MSKCDIIKPQGHAQVQSFARLMTNTSDVYAKRQCQLHDVISAIAPITDATGAESFQNLMESFPRRVKVKVKGMIIKA